jgi:two-component system KDP operon response regulator KdpE
MTKMTILDGRQILIIDDDPIIRHLLGTVFSQAGARTINAADGAEGLRLLFEHRPDLIILDIMMPEKSGWEVCAQIRTMTDIPIIMLTSLNTEDATVRALETGANDFVSKPFSNKILLARAQAALRQAAPPQPKPRPSAGYQDAYLCVDLEGRKVSVYGERKRLTKTEYKLLTLLVRHPGQVLTFNQILSDVWGPGYEDSIDYVHSYVSRLRRKLEIDVKEPRYLISEHGVGYRFQPQN